MRKRRRAYRQGDLDGLCGVYAIVNALRYVLRLRDEQCKQLFAKLIKALEQDSPCLHKSLLRGLYWCQLKRLVAVAGKGRCGDRDLTFQAHPLRLKQDQHTLPDLWAALEQELGPACVAIVGITGATDHWCVVYQVTPKTLWLLDSDGGTYMRRSRCTVRPARTRYCLELGEILLIER
ncbi:hypothetical protein [Microvirga arabica]|uniref:hypothetical protein n=1 Tax=Microvirga arabica TaxID=1128671 RepID=UPI00193AA232|nr:hypothetical protein [Microvirga arabica]MBM1172324.1 hypothetical protein [Microvirga arabica]